METMTGRARQNATPTSPCFRVRDRSRSPSADTSLRWTSPTEWRRSWSNLSVEHRNERAEAEHDAVVGRLRGRSRAKRGEPFGLGGMQLNEWLFPLKAFREMQGEADGEVSRARTSPAVNARDPTRSRRLRSAPAGLR